MSVPRCVTTSFHAGMMPVELVRLGERDRVGVAGDRDAGRVDRADHRAVLDELVVLDIEDDGAIADDAEPALRLEIEVLRGPAPPSCSIDAALIR